MDCSNVEKYRSVIDELRRKRNEKKINGTGKLDRKRK